MKTYLEARQDFRELDLVFEQGTAPLSAAIMKWTAQDNGEAPDFSHVLFLFNLYGAWYARQAVSHGVHDVLFSEYVAQNPRSTFHLYRMKRPLAEWQRAAIMTRSGQLLTRPYGKGQIVKIAAEIALNGHANGQEVGDDRRLICTEAVERSFAADFRTDFETPWAGQICGVKLTPGQGFDNISPNLQSASALLHSTGTIFTWKNED